MMTTKSYSVSQAPLSCFYLAPFYSSWFSYEEGVPCFTKLNKFKKCIHFTGLISSEVGI